MGEAAHVVADLARPDEPSRVVDEAATSLGGLDVLVNNVGIARIARFEDVPDDEWDATWQLNVMSYVRAIRAALPHLRAAGGGRDRERLLDGGEASLDVDAALLGDEGRRPLALAAGRRPLCSRRQSGATPSHPGRPRPRRGSPTAVSPTSKATATPLSRRPRRAGRSVAWRSRREIADAIVFLCSERASYVTGAAWSVDGGTVPIIL